MVKKFTATLIVVSLIAGTIFLIVSAQGEQRRQTRRQSNISTSQPIAKSDIEKKMLDVLEDMRRNESRGMMNVPPEDGRMLRLLTETTNAQNVVEIGTSNGYSGIWISLGLKTTGGKLTTYEINARSAKLARRNFTRAGVYDIVTLVEGDAHQKVTDFKDPIDVLFIDADKEGYYDYFKKLNALVRPGGLILAHNVTMGDRGIQDFLKAVTQNKDMETLFYNTGGGLSITLKKRTILEPEEELKVIRTPDVIFVPTPQEIVDKMLELARVKKDDLVYDLGCGDGRIVVTAAQKYGCVAKGFDIDPQRVRESRENVRKNNVGHLVTIEQKDIFTLDLSEVDVVTLYLLPTLNVKLIPQLQKMKPGSRIVSHDFNMEGVKPDKVITVKTENQYYEKPVYLWTTPLKIIKDDGGAIK